MIYDIRLVTSASYQTPVPFARHVLRLCARPGARQRVLAESVLIDPEPCERIEMRDFFGNRTIWSTIEAPHARLIVRAQSRVEVEASARVDPRATPAWELTAHEAVASADFSPASPVHYLFPSRRIALSEEIGRYAGQCFAPGRPVLEGALALMGRIHEDFAYISGVTDVSTSPQEAFLKRRGVCQDFAHVMIAGMRWLGLPCAYVSGFLRTTPPPGQPRLEGVDATHAWASVWCGGEWGWVGLDPTNAVAVSDDHVVLAIGRDYADVAPLDGVVLTHGAQHVDIAVDVAPAA